MFCSNCGTNMPDNSAFCPSCGTPNANAAQQNAQYNAQYNAQPNAQYNTQYNPQYVQQAPGQPMGWYKFLIYFSLFAGAILNVITGVMTLTGAHYDGGAELVYAFFDGLQAVDVIFGIICLAVAALAIYTRMQLAAYRASGPKFLSYLYVGTIVGNLFYIIGLTSVIGELTEYIDMTQIIIQIVVSAVMVFVNKTYFDKRAHMFTN